MSEKAFQVEETAVAKALRQEPAWGAQSPAKRSIWLTRSEQGGLEKMRPRDSGGPDHPGPPWLR